MKRGMKRWMAAALAAAGLYAVLSAGYAVPILMYHHIDERDREWKLSVSPASFARQMEFLKAHRYRVLSLDAYADILSAGKRPPKKSVVITFDDGYDNNFVNAYPVLRKMGFPAVIFYQLNGLGRPGYLTQEDMAILSENGVEIGSHTLTHAFLPGLKTEELKREIADSKTELEKILGRPVRLFSYPGGGYTPEAAQMVREAGYGAAVATNTGPLEPKDVFTLRRIRVSRTSDNLFVYWLVCSGFYHWIEAIRS